MLKKASLLSIGAIVAHAISFLTLPVLARIYGPTEFGKFSILVAAGLMFTPLATLKLETLIVVEKNVSKARLYLRIAVFMTLFLSILIFFLFLVLRTFSVVGNQFKFDDFWLFLPFIIIVNSIILLSQQIILRAQSYKVFSLTGISQSFFVALSQISLSLITPKAIYLFFGWFLGKIIGISWILPKTRELWRHRAKVRRIYLETFRGIFPQIKFLNQGSLFESIAVAFPTVYVGIVFGNEFAGMFSLSQVLLMAPIVLVGSGIGSLILTEYSGDPGFASSNIQYQKRGIRKIFFSLVVISVLYIVFYYLLAGILVRRLLGPEWLSALELFTLIIVPYSVGLVWYPLVNLFWSKQDWRGYRRFASVRMILPITLGLFSYIGSLDWKLTICLISWGTAISQLTGIYSLNKKWNFINPKRSDLKL
jgi:O-antigen/teichoic acid export membrane protein